MKFAAISMRVGALALIMLWAVAACGQDAASPYQLKPGQFPPHGSEHRVRGELVMADYVRRCGQFRNSESGELVNFTLLPYGTVMYAGTQADLRDVPLGTTLTFYLYQDQQKAYRLAASVRDDFTLQAAQGRTYRLDAIQLEQKLVEATLHGDKGPDLGHSQLHVPDGTRIWKGDKQVQLREVAIGDELLVDFAGDNCAELWVGVDTHRLAAERQRIAHKNFLKLRGLPGWIDRVTGKQVTFTLFGDPTSMQALFKDENIVAEQFAKEHRYAIAVVANEELRSYNPPVDGQRSRIAEFESLATDCFGPCGVRWVIEPELLLEGFRRGRIIRLFAQGGWPVNDMPFGESLYSEMPGVRIGVEEPEQYSYRTDDVNQDLPWYQLRPAVFPPLNSQHVVSGELLSVDVDRRVGQFRTGRTGEIVNFALLPYGYAQRLGAPTELAALPLDTRYQFYLYQDPQGEFTHVAAIIDDFSRMAAGRMSYRLEVARLGEGKLNLAHQLGRIKNDRDELYRPPDLAHAEFLVNDRTRIWKDGRQVSLGDLAAGDELLVNLAGDTTREARRVTEIYVGPETFERVTKQGRDKYDALVKRDGFAAWIDDVDANKFSITFFAGPSMEFQNLFHDGPPGQNVCLALLDDQLRPLNERRNSVRFLSSKFEVGRGTYGGREVRWFLEAKELPDGFHPGQVVRVFSEACSPLAN